MASKAPSGTPENFALSEVKSLNSVDFVIMSSLWLEMNDPFLRSDSKRQMSGSDHCQRKDIYSEYVKSVVIGETAVHYGSDAVDERPLEIDLAAFLVIPRRNVGDDGRLVDRLFSGTGERPEPLAVNKQLRAVVQSDHVIEFAPMTERRRTSQQLFVGANQKEIPVLSNIFQ